MTKQELEKAIENGESVWIIGEDIQGKKKVGTKRLIKYDEIFNNKLNGFWCLNKIFKTKVEAEHYLYHANVKRVEKLPFVTWEEFLEKKEIEFTDINGRQVLLYIIENNHQCIQLEHRYKGLKYWDLTEENFYKAYDECVRLYKGETK